MNATDSQNPGDELRDESISVPTRFEVEIFRTGHYGAKGTWTVDDLDQIANSYDPEISEAPVTLDHQQIGPSHGWVGSIRRSGEKLVACLKSVSPALRKLIDRGAYRKRSVELYRNFQSTGKPYLKALSFLGAAPPQVQGLQDPMFHETADLSNGGSLVVQFDESLEQSDTSPEFGDGDIEKKQETVSLMSASDGRKHLMDHRIWNPHWDALGFEAFFETLTNENHQLRFLEFLETKSPTVSFDQSAVQKPSANQSIESFRGSVTDESIGNHQRALAFQSSDPTLSYVEALLRATSGSNS